MYKNRIFDMGEIIYKESFNPCFNGTMYKNRNREGKRLRADRVSILVLMELCIKTFPHQAI
mgnify:FL=1